MDALPLDSVPKAAFADWTSGVRDSAAVAALEEAADSVTLSALASLREVCGAPGSSWATLLGGVRRNSSGEVEPLLALLLALLARPNTAAPAASALLAAMSCGGAASHGVFHPLVLFELTKALRLLLDEGAMEEDRTPVLDGIRQLLERSPLRSHAEVHAQLIALLAGVGAYAQLGLCLGDTHGDAEHTLPAVMRAVLPTLALEHGTDAKALSAQRECVDFVALAVEGQLSMAGVTEEGGKRAAAALQAVQALLQRASVAAHDRARDKVCAGLARLLVRLPPVASAAYVGFLIRYARTAKPSARTFAVEMAGAVLREAAGAPHAPEQGVNRTRGAARPTGLHGDGIPQALWRLLVQRLSDKVAAVRAKTVGVLGKVLKELQEEAPTRELLRLVQMPPPPSERPTPASGAASCHSSHSHHATPCSGLSRSGGAAAPSATGSLVSLTPSALASPAAALLEAASTVDVSFAVLSQQLLSMCVDPKVNVRRAALGTLETVVRAAGVQLGTAQLGVVAKRCQDSSPLIRKQAARTLGELLTENPAAPGVRAAWLSGVLPLLRDAETSVSDAAIDLLRDGLLVPLDRCYLPADEASASPHQAVVWSLLEGMTAETEAMLARGVAKLAQLQRLPSHLGMAAVALLDADAATPTPTSAPRRAGRSALWAIVVELSKHCAGKSGGGGASCRLDGPRIARCYDAAAARSPEVGAHEATCALRALTSLAKRGELDEVVARAVVANVERCVRELTAPPELMAPLVQACATMKPNASEWARPLMATCEVHLTRGVGAPSAAAGTALVVVGELAMAIPSLVTPSLIAAVQAIATWQADATPPPPGVAEGGAEAAAEAAAAAAAAGALAATAFVTLGKCCHGDRACTERLLPVFLRELGSNVSAAVRNNALVVLFDLCKAHTHLVDRHVPALGYALGDTCALVRQQALLLVTELLLENTVR